jgi:CHASE2 domain-containing sensor protein
VLATSLLAPEAGDETSPKGGEPWIRRRVVLYGISSDAFGDRIDTPAATGIPGIYLHAMALRNLLEYGDEYKRAPNGLRWWIRTAAICFLIGGLAVLRNSAEVSDQLKRSRIQRWLKRLSGAWTRTVVASAGVIAVSFGLYACADVGPG